MAQKEVRNNATINTNNNMEGANVMTKDMLREELKKHGIEMSNNEFKKTKHERLVELLGEAIQAQVPVDEIDKAKVGVFEDKTPVIPPVNVPVGDMSSDNYYPAFDFNIKAVDNEHLQKICHNIWLRSYECTKSLSEENIGKRMIKKNQLYGAIYDAYKKEIGKAEVPDKFYQRICWSLEHCGYITIKKYDDKAFVIFVEDKCKASVKVTTNTVNKIDITFHNADVQTDGIISISKDSVTVHRGTYCIATLRNNTHDIRVTVTKEADTTKVNALIDALLA